MPISPLRILITGHTSGIGRAAFAMLEARGHRVVGISSSATTIAGMDGIDVSDGEAVAAAVKAVAHELGGIDVCIPNAGIGYFDPLEQAKLAHWKRMVDVNVNGVLNTIHAALPHLLESRGHVINIGSVAARQVFPNSGVYCATKHAVLAISDGLRMEFRDRLAVTTINPGSVNTPFIDRTENEELRSDYRPQFDAGMSPEFVAEAICSAVDAGGRGVYSEVTLRPDYR